MHCQHCGKDGPEGLFCTFCGARQGTGSAGARRHDTFAADPTENVNHPGLFTTLFPHLAHPRVHDFRLAFIAAIAVVLALDIAGLISAALVAAAFLVPILYLLYLYDAQVYRDAPARVIGFSLGGGVVVGLAVTLAARAIGINILAVRADPMGGLIINPGALVLGAIALPIVQELLKPLPVLALRGRFKETADGLSFGVAAGLGFAMAETLVNFADYLTRASFRTESATWIYALVSLAILTPLLQGSATGALAAGLWRLGRRRQGLALVVILAAVAAHVLFNLGTDLLAALRLSQLVWLTWQALVVAGVLVATRYLLHEALMEEAGDLGLADAVCANCHARVSAAGFCPRCGQALTVGPAGLRVTRGA